MNTLKILLTIGAILIGFHIAKAGQFSYLSLNQRYTKSDAVVLAVVKGYGKSQYDQTSGVIQTPMNLEILHAWKGNINSNVVTVYLLGGEVNGVGFAHSAEIFPSVNDTVIMFIKHSQAKWRPSFFGYSYIFMKGSQTYDILRRFDNQRSVIDSLNMLGRSFIGTLNSNNNQRNGRLIAPSITGISPPVVWAGIGDTVTITGSNFGTAPNPSAGTYVAFPNPNDGGATFDPVENSLYYISWTDTEIKVLVPFNFVAPSDLAGTGSVQVCVNGACATSIFTLTVDYSVYEPIFNGERRTIHYANIGNTGGYAFIPSDSFKNVFTGAWEVLKRAMTTWRCNTYVNIDTLPGTTTTNIHQNDNTNVVAYTTIDGAGGTLAFATWWYFYCLNGSVRDYYVGEIDIVVDKDENWYVGSGTPPSTQYDLESVLLHELGHALGLGHIISSLNVMHWAIGPGETRRTLQPNNIVPVTNKLNISTTGTHCHPIMTPLNITNCSYFCNMSVSVQQEDITCYGWSDGWIRIEVTGSSPFTHYWTPTPANRLTSPDGSVDSIWGLGPGTWTDSIVDAQNCVKVVSVTIQEPPPLTISLDSIQHVACKGDSTGYIAVSASGGTPGYTYSWSNGQTTSTVTGLWASDYVVAVIDANGCQERDTFTITEPPTYLTISVDSVHEPLCYGQGSGSIFISVAGGGPPYQIIWSNGDTGATISNIPPDTYIVNVIDTFGCSKYDTVVLQSPPPVTIASSNIVQPSVCGASDGSIDIQISGGTPPYQVTWSNGDTGTYISNLSAGIYTATVTDSNGCIFDFTFILSDPNAPVIVIDSVVPPSCNGSLDGAIYITVSGGTSPYSFQWSNGSTTEDLSGIGGGTYTLTVIGADGCQNSISVTIQEPPALVVTVTVDTVNDKAWANASGGTPPYTYTWTGGITTDTFSIPGPGTYWVTVTDSNGCFVTDTFIIDTQTVDVLLTSNKQCFIYGYFNKWTLSCKGVRKIDIYSIDGRLIKSWVVGAPSLLRLPPGLTLIVIHTHSHTSRFIINPETPATLYINRSP